MICGFPSSDAQQLMGLQTQFPTRVLEAVARGELSVELDLRTIHRLQEKVLEVEPLELCRCDAALRIDQLELVARTLLDRGPGFWADANPIESGGRFERAVGLDRDFEAEGGEGRGGIGRGPGGAPP